MMDEKHLEQQLAEELIAGWQIIATGSGFLVSTDWHWPNDERIEIYVRTVGEREDLYIVTDGGDLYNFLFSQGIDLSRDENGMKIFSNTAERYGVRILDGQMVKGSSDGDLAGSIRKMLEAVKDASFLLWHKLNREGWVH